MCKAMTHEKMVQLNAPFVRASLVYTCFQNGLSPSTFTVGHRSHYLFDIKLYLGSLLVRIS